MSEVNCPFTPCGQTNMTERCSENSMGACGLGINWQTVCSQNSGQEEFVFLLKKNPQHASIMKGAAMFWKWYEKRECNFLPVFWSKHPFITNILYWVNILNKISMELIKSIYNIIHWFVIMCKRYATFTISLIVLIHCVSLL